MSTSATIKPTRKRLPKRIRMSIAVDRETYERMTQIKRNEKRTMNSIVELALAGYLSH